MPVRYCKPHIVLWQPWLHTEELSFAAQTPSVAHQELGSTRLPQVCCADVCNAPLPHHVNLQADNCSI
jgi:hypothetical protein